MHVRNVTGQYLEGNEGISLNNLCICFTMDTLLQLCMIIFATGVFIFYARLTLMTPKTFFFFFHVNIK